MNRRTFLASSGLTVAGTLAGCSAPSDNQQGNGDTATDSIQTDDSATAVTVETVADGLESPWSITPLPDGSQLLVTERVGSVVLVDSADGTVTPVSNAPSVYASGQGGMLDAALHPDFPDPAWMYLTYSKANDSGESATHLGRGRLNVTDAQFEEFEQLHVAEPFVDSDGHFGSRVVFGPDGLVYMTVGDRQFKNFGPDHVAQDRTNELGTTLRLTPSGGIPDANPFIDDPDAVDSIFSYGHRNAQGMTVHPDTGAIWQAEFGEQDGDEINIVERGANYGWPVADEGCTYGSGDPIGVSHADRDDVVAPVYSWDCGSGGFPPSGATFYTGDAFTEWTGDLLVGGLASQYLARFTVDGRTVEEATPLLADRGWRIRDVVVEPGSGHILAVVDASNAPIVRLQPT
ncbi:PQQ-dependent sugar dehydrogenase [Haloarcula marismortui]|uniref:Glucose sorbosone dehydrogenase n=1 Tax=Haloarcula marismortui ATCC 33800 TaxID=662476 RepID=M0JNC8_9EURY|nr:PQQ-dependent sugar dehydrogenase [Haloarcula sinaiiensis]EMA10652.1 glucose sorbosone dehydrogenase [Haloarcula sinaiiensis ATCC 33800]QUJ74500.1 PQQ-dependent sugar dehydrogenase [Haloarcula sinaiiensis ATCC 33800]